MKIMRLEDLQQSIKQNQKRHEQSVMAFTRELHRMNLKKERIRPKEPDEQRILSSFKRK